MNATDSTADSATDNIPTRPAREERVVFKASDAEKRAYKIAAALADADLSDWIRKTLNAALAAEDARARGQE